MKLPCNLIHINSRCQYIANIKALAYLANEQMTPVVRKPSLMDHAWESAISNYYKDNAKVFNESLQTSISITVAWGFVASKRKRGSRVDKCLEKGCSANSWRIRDNSMFARCRPMATYLNSAGSKPNKDLVISELQKSCQHVASFVRISLAARLSLLNSSTSNLHLIHH